MKEQRKPPRLQWFGQAGHFIAAEDCRFHLHTHVGRRYCVSTVGDYWPPHRVDPEGPETIGIGRLYETMVFPLTKDGTDVADWSGLEMAPYTTRDDADAGHARMVRKWSRR